MTDIKTRIAKALEDQRSVSAAKAERATTLVQSAKALYEGPATEALAELREAFEPHGRTVTADFLSFRNQITFRVTHEGKDELRIDLIVEERVISTIEHCEDNDGRYRAETVLRDDGRSYRDSPVTKGELVRFIGDRWTRNIQHASR